MAEPVFLNGKLVPAETAPCEINIMAWERQRTVLMKIALLAGGESAERDVSLETGRCVAKALLELGHRILPFDPARGGESLVSR